MREEFEVYWDKNASLYGENGTEGDIFMAWDIWQAATKATIQRIQSATVAQSTLPGALTLSGDFFKVK